MKKLYTILLCALAAQTFNAQVVLNEVMVILGVATVELHNQGGSPVDISGYYLCNFPNYMSMTELTVVSDDTDLVLDADEYIVMYGLTADAMHGELGLYMNNTDFADSDNILDYMEYGEGGHQREPVAVAAGQWTVGGFAPTVNFLALDALAYDGSGNAPSDWQQVNPPTPDAQNIVGVEELSVSTVITVYPNPAAEKISVQCVQKGMVRMFDARGTLVKEMEKTSGELVMDVRDVVNGNYFIELNGRTVQFRIEN